MSVKDGSRISGGCVTTGHCAATTDPVAVELAGTLQETFGTAEAPAQPPGLGQSLGVPRMLGQTRLPFGEPASRGFEQGRTAVQRCGRRGGQEFTCPIQFEPCGRQLFDHRRCRHLFEPGRLNSGSPQRFTDHAPANRCRIRMVSAGLILRSKRLDAVGAARVISGQGSRQAAEGAGEFDTVTGCVATPVGGFSRTAPQFLNVLRLARFSGGESSVINFHIRSPALAD